MNDAAFIASVPLFQGLPERHLESVRSVCSDVPAGKGKMVFLEGARAEGFYVVRQGRIKVFKISPEGREQVLHVFGPGEPVGEVAVFEGGSFPANAQAVEDSRLLYISRASLKTLMQRDATLAMNMLAVLSKRLRVFTHKIEDLTLKEVPARLAAYLLDLSERSDGPAVELDIAKGLLANLLGTAQETLSRILKRMSEQELIRVQGRSIELLDTDALQDLADGATRLD
jgi:CRP/FNR family transcriptional regulator